MSADNWGKCPKCKTIAPVLPAYGSVSEAEYLAAREKKPPLNDPTLREDYEIFTDEDGMFVASYGCSCTRCGFNFSFNHRQQIYPKN